MALAPASCAKPSSSSSQQTTVTIGMAVPRAGAASGASTMVENLTLEAPVAITWDGRPTPRAIDKWEWSADGLALRLHLSRGIRFHDGTELTNALAAEILRKGLTPEGAAVSSTVQSVTAEGADDIVIRTGQPEGFLLSDISTQNFALPGKPTVGTGPFVVVSKSAPITLRAFDGYHWGRPAIDQVKITEYGSQRQAWAAMMRGETDVLHTVSGESLRFVLAESTVQTKPFLRAYHQVLLVNLKLPLFAQKDLRRALNVAVDRQQIVSTSLRGHGMPADGPVWPYHFAHAQTGISHKFDPVQAGRLMDGLGLTAGREREPGRMPSRFRFTCLVPREDQLLQRVALLVQKQLYNVGVDMNVELAPAGQVVARLASGDYEAVLILRSSTRSLSGMYTMWHTPPPDQKNAMNLGYGAADQALDRLRAAYQEREVRLAVADVERVFYEDPPAVFLDWNETARALRKTIEVPNEGARDVLGSIQQWRPVAASSSR